MASLYCARQVLSLANFERVIITARVHPHDWDILSKLTMEARGDLLSDGLHASRLVTPVKRPRQSLLPRFMHQFYAFLFSYFWIACPCCGRMFGGHEIGHRSIPDPHDIGLGHTCCKWCD